jgi:small conductance mechanosensitive channel
METFTIRSVIGALATIAIEIGLLAAVSGAVYLFAMWLVARLATLYRGSTAESIDALRVRVRASLVGMATLSAVGILCYNGWLIARGADVPGHTLVLLGAVSANMWIGLAMAVTKLAAATIGVVFAVRVVRRVLHAIEAALNRWDRLRDNDRSLHVLFSGLNRAIVATTWMLLAVYALRLFGLPEALRDGLLMVVRAYIVVAIGLLVIRSSVVIVDTLDGLSHRYAQTHGLLRYYDHLRPLIPTFRACLEYALWVAVASLALLQLGPMGAFAVWAPRLIQAIGIFFLGRVVIELGRLEIGRRLLPAEGLDEMTHRRRATMAPLVRTGFTYAVYFGSAVLILATLGFNPLPFLAGAGILGLVVGFGAQSLINDVVSGFFILFENTYLVGDVIEAAGGRGVVEAIEFRTTKIRDGDGRVHVIRNGDVKDVINYSKEYTMAVVPVDVAYDADLRRVFAILDEAGRRLRAENPDVIADTQIDGVTAFGATTMTVRTSTRVKPGRHEAAAAALRLLIKEACDLRATGTRRRGLVPAESVSPITPDPRDRRERNGKEAGPGLFAGQRRAEKQG